MIENLATLGACLAGDRAEFADPFADGDARQLAGKALHCGDPGAPYGLQRALHISCCTDIRHTLAMAGFSDDSTTQPLRSTRRARSRANGR